MVAELFRAMAVIEGQNYLLRDFRLENFRVEEGKRILTKHSCDHRIKALIFLLRLVGQGFSRLKLTTTSINVARTYTIMPSSPHEMQAIGNEKSVFMNKKIQSTFNLNAGLLGDEDKFVERFAIGQIIARFEIEISREMSRLLSKQLEKCIWKFDSADADEMVVVEYDIFEGKFPRKSLGPSSKPDFFCTRYTSLKEPLAIT